MIRIRGLVNAFNGHVIHDHLDLDVMRGEVLGVVGGSGTGKSVLLRSIVGLNHPVSGSIKVFGVETADMEAEDLQGLATSLGGAVSGRRVVQFADRGGKYPGAAAPLYPYEPGTDG